MPCVVGVAEHNTVVAVVVAEGTDYLETECGGVEGGLGGDVGGWSGDADCGGWHVGSC